jgi:hypothetical protein
MSNGTFDLNEFIRESKEVLVNPKSYFSTMKTSGGMSEPLIKAVIYGVVAGVLTFLWGLLKFGAGTGLGFGGAVGVQGLIWSLFFAIIGLFIGAVILLVISAICKGNTDFEANVRVTAASMVVYPVSALLGFAGNINLYLGIIISLAVSLYALWILYNGLVEALKTKPETTRIVMYVLVALYILIMIAGIGTKRRANQIMKDFDRSDLKEMMKDFPEN